MLDTKGLRVTNALPHCKVASSMEVQLAVSEQLYFVALFALTVASNDPKLSGLEVS